MINPPSIEGSARMPVRKGTMQSRVPLFAIENVSTGVAETMAAKRMFLWLYLFYKWRCVNSIQIMKNNLLFVICAVSLVIAIYGALCFRILPLASTYIQGLVLCVFTQYGSTRGLVAVALFQVLLMKMALPALSSQLFQIITQCDILAVLHSRLRNTTLVAVLVLVEGVVVLVLFDTALLQMTWFPFVSLLSARATMSFVLTKTAAIGGIMFLSVLCVAGRIRLSSSKHPVLMSWVLAVSYYAGVVCLFYELRREILSPEGDGLLLHCARAIMAVADGQHDLQLGCLALVLWLLACLNGIHLLAEEIYRRGLHND